MRPSCNSSNFLLLRELTEEGNVASTNCMLVMTSVLAIVQWNLLFKHVDPGPSVS